MKNRCILTQNLFCEGIKYLDSESHEKRIGIKVMQSSTMWTKWDIDVNGHTQ